MEQILIATHGKMASGIRYTAELIVGQLAEITTIDAYVTCLLYTSDAADEEDSVDLGGSRNIKKKKNNHCEVKKRTPQKITQIVGIHLLSLRLNAQSRYNV